MKKFILLLTIMAFSLTGYANYSRNGNTFKAEQSKQQTEGEKTKYTWEDKDGKKYQIYITKNGACYILRTSKKTGKEYKQYLQKCVQEQIKKELGIE